MSSSSDKSESKTTIRLVADAIEDQMASDDNMPDDLARAAIAAIGPSVLDAYHAGLREGAAEIKRLRAALERAEAAMRLEAPAWCNYPDPEQTDVGCWSLLNGWIKQPTDCGGCECRKTHER